MADTDISTPPAIRVVAPKPKMTIYYALLIIALFAMLTACGILYAEVRRLQREKGASIERPVQVLLAKSGSFSKNSLS